MVYVIASVEVAPGKMQEAQDWFKRFYGHVNKTYGLRAQWMTPLDPGPGQARRIVSITPYDSAAAWAAHQEKVAKDPERSALVREAFEEKQYVIASTFTRTLYNVG
jgi:hypothetical protein